MIIPKKTHFVSIRTNNKTSLFYNLKYNEI